MWILISLVACFAQPGPRYDYVTVEEYESRNGTCDTTEKLSYWNVFILERCYPYLAIDAGAYFSYTYTLDNENVLATMYSGNTCNATDPDVNKKPIDKCYLDHSDGADSFVEKFHGRVATLQLYFDSTCTTLWEEITIPDADCICNTPQNDMLKNSCFTIGFNETEGHIVGFAENNNCAADGKNTDFIVGKCNIHGEFSTKWIYTKQ